MDRDRLPDYLAMAREIREDGLGVEVYVGGARALKKQMAYADRAGIPLVILAGSNEFEAGTVSIKDLREGKRRDAEAGSREAWVKRRPGQQTVARPEMLATIRSLLEGG